MTKEAKERKKELLKIAADFFISKGFDHTSITDILNEAGIARGTLYYHFKSKEEIMDAVIEEYVEKTVSKAESIAKQEDTPLMERLFLIIKSMNMMQEGDGIIAYLHRPQNALMHEKSNAILVKRITPILSVLIAQGTAQGIFDTKYPYEAVEMMLVYSIHIFGHTFMSKSQEEKLEKAKAFLYSLEKLFGAAQGSFDALLTIIGGETHA